MDERRFDELTRALVTGVTRRAVVAGMITALTGAIGAHRSSAAQVTQAQCGNKQCAKNPGICANGCVCCVYANARGQITNSRCRPPGTCHPGTVACPTGQIFDPTRGCIVPDCFQDADCQQSPTTPCSRRICRSNTCVASDDWVPDGTACGSDGQCSEGRCFRAGRSCFTNVTPGCRPIVVDAVTSEPIGLQLCLGDRPGSQAECTATRDCPADEYCAAADNTCAPGCLG